MKYFFVPGLNVVVSPSNPEHYQKVNPSVIQVRPVRGGWKPIDPKNWPANCGIIKAELISKIQ